MAPSWEAFSRAFRVLAMPLMLLAALVGPLFSQPVEAQSAPPPDSVVAASCSGSNQSFIIVGNFEVLGQVFTSAQTGTLTSAQINLVRLGPANGNTIVTLNAVDPVTGAPTNTVLATSAPIPNASIPTTPQPITFNFSPGVTLVAGQKYALVVSGTEPPNIALVGASVTVPCPNAPLYASFNGGPFLQTSVSLIFTVFVTPLSPGQPTPGQPPPSQPTPSQPTPSQPTPQQQPTCPPAALESGIEPQSGDVSLSSGTENSGDYAHQVTPTAQNGDTGNMENAPSVLQTCGSTSGAIEPGGISKEISPVVDVSSPSTIDQSSSS